MRRRRFRATGRVDALSSCFREGISPRRGARRPDSGDGGGDLRIAKPTRFDRAVDMAIEFSAAVAFDVAISLPVRACPDAVSR